MDLALSAATKVFNNSLILHEVCTWVKLGGKKDLVPMLVLNSHGMMIAAKSMYGRVGEDLPIKLATACCAFVSRDGHHSGTGFCSYRRAIEPIVSLPEHGSYRSA